MSRATLLEDFRAARHADEIAREAADLGYATERAMHKADGARQPITLAAFLRHAQPAAPSPDEQLEQAYAVAADMRREAVVMADLAKAYAAQADAEIAALSKLGETYRDIARRLEVSPGRVGQWMDAHKRRARQARHAQRTAADS